MQKISGVIAATVFVGLLLVPGVALARVRLVLFEPGTSALEAMRQIGFNANAFFKTLDRCAPEVPYPCRRKPVDGQYIGRGVPTAEGECLLPTMYVFAGYGREFSVSITVNKSCGLRFHNYGPVLSFPDRLDFQPQVLSFPDPDQEGPGWFPQPLVAVGQKIGRRRWVKAKTKKPNGDVPTRILAGMDAEERLLVKGITPSVTLLKNLNFYRFNSTYPWRPTAHQELPGLPAPAGPYTLGNTQTATFTNQNTNATHTMIAQTRLGPNAAQAGECFIAGTLPNDASAACEHRFSVLYGPLPL